jgi:hydrogenase expression/formation protein HypC
MKIKQIEGDFAKTESSGLERSINIEMLRDVKIGDYVIVHAGFAIEKVDPKKAKETLSIINEFRPSHRRDSVR